MGNTTEIVKQKMKLFHIFSYTLLADGLAVDRSDSQALIESFPQETFNNQSFEKSAKNNAIQDDRKFSPFKIFIEVFMEFAITELFDEFFGGEESVIRDKDGID